MDASAVADGRARGQLRRARDGLPEKKCPDILRPSGRPLEHRPGWRLDDRASRIKTGRSSRRS
eukprot:5049953-Prymnesium_polylepis.1